MYCLIVKNMSDISRTKAVLKSALSSIPQDAKNAPSIHPALEPPVLIRNDSLTFEESKAKKKVCKYFREEKLAIGQFLRGSLP